jgi:hypothetical protein
MEIAEFPGTALSVFFGEFKYSIKPIYSFMRGRS